MCGSNVGMYEKCLDVCWKYMQTHADKQGKITVDEYLEASTTIMVSAKGVGLPRAVIDWLSEVCGGADVLLKAMGRVYSYFKFVEAYVNSRQRTVCYASLSQNDSLCAMVGYYANSDLFHWLLERGVVPSPTTCFMARLGMYNHISKCSRCSTRPYVYVNLDYADILTACVNQGYIRACIHIDIYSAHCLLDWCLRCNSVEGIHQCHVAVDKPGRWNVFYYTLLELLTWDETLLRNVTPSTIDGLASIIGINTFVSLVVHSGKWLDTENLDVQMRGNNMCKLGYLSEKYGRV